MSTGNDLDDFDNTINQVNDFARFVFNTSNKDVKQVLGNMDGTFKDKDIMKLFDTYCCGYLFLLSLSLVGKFGDEANQQLEIIFVDIAKLLVFVSGELAVGSSFVREYTGLKEKWFDDDPLVNPVLYTVELVKRLFNSDQFTLITESYFSYQKRIDDSIKA